MNPTEQTMLNVIEETFASLAFMFPVEPDEAEAQAPLAMERAVVEFFGPLRGSLLLSVSEKMLEPLTANMLGLEDGVSPSGEQKEDAFKELLNVICGNLLPLIASPREVFNVHEPYLLAEREDDRPAPGMENSATVDVDLDAGHVRLTLWVASQSVDGVLPPGKVQA